MSLPKVSVIMAVYNRAPLLPELLDAWRVADKATTVEYELIFSDDESADNSVEVLEACDDLPVRVLRNKHGGAAGARNAAYPHARGELIIFTGDDIFPEPDFVNLHWDTYQKNGPGYATLGRLEWREGIEMTHLMTHITTIGCEQFGFPYLPAHDLVDFRHFYTSNIAVPRAQLERQSCLFDRTFKQYGFEDIELGYRLYKQGMKIYYNPDILGYHDHVYRSVHHFCRRQLSAGMELSTFQQLHPEMTDDEIKVDLEQFGLLLKEYVNPAVDLLADVGRLFLTCAKPVTVLCERWLKRRESPRMRRLCSRLYRAIFAHTMHMGIALGNPICSGNRVMASRFAFRYLYGGRMILAFVVPEPWHQKRSLIRLMGRRRIRLQKEIALPGGILQVELEGGGWKMAAMSCVAQSGDKETAVDLVPSKEIPNCIISQGRLPADAGKVLIQGKLHSCTLKKLARFLIK